MLFPHKVTIFNSLSEEDEEYNRAVLQPALFILDENTGRNKLGLTNADTVTVYIPSSAVDLLGKQYVEPAAYNQMTDKSGVYTFRKGDLVALGDIDLGSKTINEFKNTEENLYEITGRTDYRFGGLPNIVLSAK